ncbi:MAG: translocation/assembly module TamB domain-containing protein, partial [Calditrichia bacterium]
MGYKTVDWDFRNLKSIFADNSFGLLCKIEEDSVNFLSTVLPDVDRVIGDISVEAKFGGNISRPMLYDGKIDIKNGLLYITKIENPIRDISLQAHGQDHTILIDNFNGRSPNIKPGQNIIKKFFSLLSAPFRKVVAKGYGDGSISANGSADFFYLKRPKLDLHFSLNDSYFNYFLENINVVVNSKDIHVSGRDTILVAGDATVKKGDWQLNFIESEKNILLSKSVRQTPPYIQYLLNVEIPDNFFVRSNMPFNTFDIELSGDVQIIREPKRELEMNGQLKVLPGGKYFIQVEDFNVNSGEINFVNPKEYPELNLAASRQKNDYLFELTVTGPLNNPVKNMRTRNLKTNEEIYDLKDQMTLLLFGVEFRELSGLSDSALVASGGGVLPQTLLNQFEWQARQYTGLDKIRFGSQESYDYFSGWPWEKQQQTSTLALGKYFTPDLYLEYQAKLSSTNVSGLGGIPTPNLSWESGNLVYMKYRLTKNWAL